MSKGKPGRKNRVVPLDFLNIRCLYCHGPFTEEQIKKSMNKNAGVPPKFCSVDCRRLGHSLNKTALAEPTNNKEALEFAEEINKGKQELETDEQAIIRSLTPPDDTPEAERAFRERICPNPQYGYLGYSSAVDAKYMPLVKDPGYQFHNHVKIGRND